MENQMFFQQNGAKLRETFWTPYDQMKEHIGKKFTVIRELTGDEVDEESKGQLFKIKLEDGQEIDTWFEEIYEKSCMVDGQLI